LIERGRQQAFRLQVLQTHYRAPLNFTEAGLEAAAAGLDRMVAAVRSEAGQAPAGTAADASEIRELAATTDQRFHAAMNDDLTTPMAIAALFDLAKGINRLRPAAGGAPEFAEAQRTLAHLAGILGLVLEDASQSDAGDAATFIDLLVTLRSDLRAARQWDLADSVRVGLQERGIALEDSPTGTTWKKSTP